MKKLLKLVKLLKEYEEWKVEKYGIGNYIWLLDKDLGVIFAERFPDKELITEDESRAIIISKGYNFIKWLVDNDRIDLEKLLKGIKENKIYCGKWGKTRSMLLMLLSVSDSPIDFLISVLR